MQVIAKRLWADVEFLNDVSRAFPFGESVEHPMLLLGQRINGSRPERPVRYSHQLFRHVEHPLDDHLGSFAVLDAARQMHNQAPSAFRILIDQSWHIHPDSRSDSAPQPVIATPVTCATCEARSGPGSVRPLGKPDPRIRGQTATALRADSSCRVDIATPRHPLDTIDRTLCEAGSRAYRLRVVSTSAGTINEELRVGVVRAKVAEWILRSTEWELQTEQITIKRAIGVSQA